MQAILKVDRALKFVIVLGYMFTSAGMSQAAGIISSPTFRVYNVGIYNNTPDLSQYNIGEIKIVYPNEIWLDGTDNRFPPSDVILRESVRRVYNKISSDVEYICLDIENWPVVGQPDRVAISKAYYIDIVKRFKQMMPGKKIGLYGVLPIRNYYDAINTNKPGYHKWIASVESLSEIANEVDVIFPSLYTFTDNRRDWVKYAESNIQAAKRFNKPIIPLIWPQYHQSNRLVGLKYIPADFWRLQLETIAENADGVAIWGGWDVKNKRKQDWNVNAEWWSVVLDFMRRYRLLI
ncbi:hypothetical protein [Methylomonas methanica]|uniref:Hyaluronidase n=1 Tax=Methylomonas methanica (strain DSM 25384 / MC09) TaxID=857087 RepID=G0A1G9_METMM|nr:hypothetical protein [Methylomonas methanica]AEF98862.1 hypothetical protein Metme_0417 [Methylomonas methanica MC09]